MAVHRISTMREVLRQAEQHCLGEVWIYLKDEPARLGLESQCLVLPEEEAVDAPMIYAGTQGFPLEGLNTAMIENCAAWAAQHETPPSDKLLLYAFLHYWRFERLPDQPWAPFPPADEEVPISRSPDPGWESGFEDADLDEGSEEAEEDPYGDLLDRSYDELQFQTQNCERLFQMSSASFNVDLKAGRIVFQSPQGIKASADIQVIGTFSKIRGNWLWAWANPAIPPSLCGFANAAKDYGAEQGIEDYTTPLFDCGEDDGWEFTAVANQLGGGQGAYRAPDGDRLVYLCFGPITIERIQ